MSTYMENIYNNNENNNFQSTYDSIINELINLENLTPDKSRATFLESISNSFALLQTAVQLLFLNYLTKIYMNLNLSI